MSALLAAVPAIQTALQPLLLDLRDKLEDPLFNSDNQSCSLLHDAPTETCLQLCDLLDTIEAQGLNIQSVDVGLSQEDLLFIDLIRHVYADSRSCSNGVFSTTQLERAYAHAIDESFD